MQLQITNLTNLTVVVGGPVGTLHSSESKTIDLVYSELEKLRPALLQLAKASRIRFAVASDPDATDADRDTDVLTAQDTIAAIDAGGGGGGGEPGEPGLSMMSIGPFVSAIDSGDSGDTPFFSPPFNGKFVALTVSLMAPLTSGTVTMQIYEDGNPLGPVLSMSPVDGTSKSQPMETTFYAGRVYFVAMYATDTGVTLDVSCLINAVVYPDTAATYSTEIGRTEFGNDYLLRNDAPDTGVLFSGWFRIPQLLTPPATRGNFEVFRVNYANWYARFICGNIIATDANTCSYNANSMLFANGDDVDESMTTYLGDFSYSNELDLEIGVVNDWVFCAWQILNDGASVTIRQWVRFYNNGTVLGPYESVVSHADLRTAAVGEGWTAPHAAAWTPTTNPVNFIVGDGNGYCAHLRVAETLETPSNDDISSLANTTSADATAWGQWSMYWTATGPDTTDLSGNDRPVYAAMGATLHQGPRTPVFY